MRFQVKRLMILEQLQAQPQQGSNTLQINVKMNSFFRFEGPQEPELPPSPDEKPDSTEKPASKPGEVAQR